MEAVTAFPEGADVEDVTGEPVLFLNVLKNVNNGSNIQTNKSLCLYLLRRIEVHVIIFDYAGFVSYRHFC